MRPGGAQSRTNAFRVPLPLGMEGLISVLQRLRWIFYGLSRWQVFSDISPTRQPLLFWPDRALADQRNVIVPLTDVANGVIKRTSQHETDRIVAEVIEARPDHGRNVNHPVGLGQHICIAEETVSKLKEEVSLNRDEGLPRFPVRMRAAFTILRRTINVKDAGDKKRNILPGFHDRQLTADGRRKSSEVTPTDLETRRSQASVVCGFVCDCAPPRLAARVGSQCSGNL